MRVAATLLLVVACYRHEPSPPSPTKPEERLAETFATLATAPGNIAMVPALGPVRDMKMFVSQHQAWNPKHPVVAVFGPAGTALFDTGSHPGVTNDTMPYAESANLDSVLGIRADEDGILWMLDNAMKSRGMRKLVAWNTTKNQLERIFDLSSVSPEDAFLNDLVIDRENGVAYIADSAAGKNAALIVLDLRTSSARRVLEGHESVVPTEIDLVIEGKTIGTRVGVSPIALDFKSEWLYFGPMHSTKLYRVRAADLRDPGVTPEIQYYADRPITDGISIDADQNIYLGDLANGAIGVIDTHRKYRELARGPELSWIGGFSFGAQTGHYYVVANQLHRSAVMNAGIDETKPPFRILRFRPEGGARTGQ